MDQMRLNRSKGTLKRRVVICNETGQTWRSYKEWISEMMAQGVSYNRCRKTMLHNYAIEGKTYEFITTTVK